MKKAMTLNLTQKEMGVLESLSVKRGMSKTALLRQALRIYQVVEDRIGRGERIYFENDKKGRSEILLILEGG